MNTFALRTMPDLLQAPEPDLGGGLEIFMLKRRHTMQEPAPALRMAGNDGAGAPLQTLSGTVGIRSACRSVVRWYHGGINE